MPNIYLQCDQIVVEKRKMYAWKFTKNTGARYSKFLLILTSVASNSDRIHRRVSSYSPFENLNSSGKFDYRVCLLCIISNSFYLSRDLSLTWYRYDKSEIKATILSILFLVTRRNWRREKGKRKTWTRTTWK